MKRCAAGAWPQPLQRHHRCRPPAAWRRATGGRVGGRMNPSGRRSCGSNRCRTCKQACQERAESRRPSSQGRSTRAFFHTRARFHLSTVCEVWEKMREPLVVHTPHRLRPRGVIRAIYAIELYAPARPDCRRRAARRHRCRTTATSGGLRSCRYLCCCRLALRGFIHAVGRWSCSRARVLCRRGGHPQLSGIEGVGDVFGLRVRRY